MTVPEVISALTTLGRQEVECDENGIPLPSEIITKGQEAVQQLLDWAETAAIAEEKEG